MHSYTWYYHNLLTFTSIQQVLCCCIKNCLLLCRVRCCTILLRCTILCSVIALHYSTSSLQYPGMRYWRNIAHIWRTFHHDGKISQPGKGWGGGARPPPFSLYLLSRTKLQCTLQLRGQIHSPHFYSTSIVLCGYTVRWYITAAVLYLEYLHTVFISRELLYYLIKFSGLLLCNMHDFHKLKGIVSSYFKTENAFLQLYPP